MLHTNTNSVRCRRAERGGALAVVLHVVLLLAVLGQTVFLASRHRVRVDLTSEQLWSSSESTRTVLEKLDQRLVIEAYFSPQEKLPVTFRESRKWAESFLDELVQLGKGKVVLQRFDPNADEAIKKRAERVGVKPLQLTNSSTTSLSVDVHWQGLRLVYGGGKQKVLSQFLPGSSFVAEAMLTPAVKELVTEQRRKFGYMEWPVTAVGQQTPGGIGWNVLRSHEGISKRYEFQNLKDEDGALLPEDVDTLFLFRPKDLTDRQKYVLDQFVVRGGTLVAFVDAAEYAIGPQRTFSKIPLQLDATGSKQPFLGQLLHYGIEWKPKLVADMAQRAMAPRDPLQAPYEYFAAPQMDQFGRQRLAAIAYPYFFHPLPVDWKTSAKELAKDASGKVDDAAAASYQDRFVPGMPSEEFLFQTFKNAGRGPGFYWPTWVGLREKAGGKPDLPPDVDGRVHLWSSPAALVEDPPQLVNPFGSARDAIQRNTEYAKFATKLRERLASEPRLQVPLMVEVKGKFSSVFAGQDRPKRPSEIKEEEAKKAAAKVDDPNTPVDESKQDGPPAPGKDDKQGKEADKPVAPEAPMRTTAERAGRIVVVGDADFVRDDIVRGDLAQGGGPVSGSMAAPFFAQMLDWLAEDRDLIALQSRSASDRTLRFVPDTGASAADARATEKALRDKTSLLRWSNILLPTGLLTLLGFVVLIVRRAQKRSFLASLR